MTIHDETRRVFRTRLAEPGAIVAPGVFDALTGRLVEEMGFEALYVSGFAVTASLLGMPDVGLVTLTELAGQVKRICQATRVPVIADGEAGFGNALNAMRAVREYESAGAAAIQLEDLATPKRSAPCEGLHVVSCEEHVGRIRAAVKARVDENFLIVGRSDAIVDGGLDEAIERGRAYAEAGADVIFIHGPTDSAQLEKIAGSVNVPQIVDYSRMIKAGSHPLLSVHDLEEMGFKIVIFSTSLLYGSLGTIGRVLSEIRDKGTLTEVLDLVEPKPKLMDLVQFAQAVEDENQFLTKEKA